MILSCGRVPLTTASLSMRRTERSFTDPPGFKNSHFANRSISGSSRRKSSTGTSGVLPIKRRRGCGGISSSEQGDEA